MKRSLARIHKRLRQVLNSSDPNYVESLVSNNDEGIVSHITAYGRATVEDLNEACPGFCYELVNTIHVVTRKAVESKLRGHGADEKLRLCNSVALLNVSPPCAVATALLRGDVLSVLAQGFAAIAQSGDDASSISRGSGSSGGGGSGRDSKDSSRGGGGAGSGTAEELRRLLLVMTSLLNILNVVSAGSMREYQAAAGSELATALAQSQVLEHAAAALLRLADRLHTLPAPDAAAAAGDERGSIDGGSVDGGSGGAESSTSGAGGGRGGSAGRRPHPIEAPRNIVVRLPPDLAVTPKELWGVHQQASDSLMCVINCLGTGKYHPWEYLSASVDRHPQLGPIGDFARTDAPNPAAMADDFRRLVVGPSLQLFLLTCVANAGLYPKLLSAEPIQIQIQPQQPQPPTWPPLPQALELRWTNCPLQRQTVVGATDKEPSTLAAALQAAALALQATVMGSGPVLPFAQPPHGHQPGAYPRRRPEHLSPFSSSPLCVYDIVARTCEAVVVSMERGDAASTAGGGSSSAGSSSAGSSSAGSSSAGASGHGCGGSSGSCGNGAVGRKINSILRPLRLLVRLLPELRPRQAAARLPGLWRLLAAVLSRLLVVPPSQDLIVDSAGLVNDASLLLRLRLDASGVVLPPPEWPPRQPPVPEQQPREGTHGSSSGDVDASPKAPAAGTAAGGGGGYRHSLLCALDAGLLPALEQLLRTAFAGTAAGRGAGAAAAAAGASGTAAAATGAPVGLAGSRGGAAERVMLAMHVAGSLLLASGVFPALLLYGLLSEVVPLLATLCSVLRQLASEGGDVKLHTATRLGVAVVLGMQESDVSAASYWKLIVGSLIEQVQCVLDAGGEGVTAAGLTAAPSQQQPEQQPTAAAAAAPAAATAASAAATATASNTVPDGGDEQPTINKWLQPARVDPAWLLAAAGCVPGPGSSDWGWLSAMQCMFRLWALPAMNTTPAISKIALPIAALDVATALLFAQLRVQCSLLQAYARYSDAAAAAEQAAAAGAAVAGSGSSGRGHDGGVGDGDSARALSSSSSSSSGGGGGGGGDGGRKEDSGDPIEQLGEHDDTPEEQKLQALAYLHEWMGYVQSTGAMHLYMGCFQLLRSAAMFAKTREVLEESARSGPQAVAAAAAAQGGAPSPAAAAAGAAGGPAATAVAAAAAADAATAAAAAAATCGHVNAGPGSSRADSGGGSRAMPIFVFGGPVRYLSSGEQQEVARAMLDVLEVEAVCLPWMRLRTMTADCPGHSLPLLMMPAEALDFISRCDERPWLKPFLLPGPDEYTWSQPWLKVAPPPRPVTPEEMAAAAAAYPELVRRVCERRMPLCFDQAHWAQVPGRLAADLLQPDIEPPAAGHDADLDGASQADEGGAVRSASGGGRAGAGGGAGGGAGDSSDSQSAARGAAAVAAVAAAAAPWICGNPACRNLDGPSALIPPGAGKTCARCRDITYCCGACQLAHWREGLHAEVCPFLVQVQQLRQRSSAALG
ncbi:hypothetical protein CHLRE_05g241632v5 [Chlamydomonas reinhardtii]|uniref:phytol kinase n=1 Tax=Chlamydomonas reinhardtii TaxID=3055 RepID=A0A2K3DSI1_CHLRE|nr:uncharacterized protein CHLRE_05g241632v5 [Chlamydomonas reinhardtii]PNW83491.1 hypothetical protein CHLRE_05g241632v5 [Chlamydomonas reinhardtii]